MFLACQFGQSGVQSVDAALELAQGRVWALAITALQRPTAAEATFQTMDFTLIEPLGSVTPAPGMTVLGAGLLMPLGGIGLGLDGQHARWRCGGRWLTLALSLQFGDARLLFDNPCVPLGDAFRRGKQR